MKNNIENWSLFLVIFYFIGSIIFLILAFLSPDYNSFLIHGVMAFIFLSIALNETDFIYLNRRIEKYIKDSTLFKR